MIVSCEVPLCAFRCTDIVSVELPEPATDVGLNEALVCAGSPLTLKFTVAEKDPSLLTVTVYVVCEPRCTFWLLGEVEMVKSATTRVTSVE